MPRGVPSRAHACDRVVCARQEIVGSRFDLPMSSFYTHDAGMQDFMAAPGGEDSRGRPTMTSHEKDQNTRTMENACAARTAEHRPQSAPQSAPRSPAAHAFSSPPTRPSAQPSARADLHSAWNTAALLFASAFHNTRHFAAALAANAAAATPAATAETPASARAADTQHARLQRPGDYHVLCTAMK